MRDGAVDHGLLVGVDDYVRQVEHGVVRRTSVAPFLLAVAFHQRFVRHQLQTNCHLVMHADASKICTDQFCSSRRQVSKITNECKQDRIMAAGALGLNVPEQKTGDPGQLWIPFQYWAGGGAWASAPLTRTIIRHWMQDCRQLIQKISSVIMGKKSRFVSTFIHSTSFPLWWQSANAKITTGRRPLQVEVDWGCYDILLLLSSITL